MKKASLIVLIMVLLSAVPVVAQSPGWWVKLWGICSDSDRGPTDAELPLPYITIGGRARDAQDFKVDRCVTEKGEEASVSRRISEAFCKDRRVATKEYDCTKYGYAGCSDPGDEKGAVCVKEIPAPVCGDGVQTASEQCDPPGGACAMANGQAGLCDKNCKCGRLQPPPKRNCGNSLVEFGEECDPPGFVCNTKDGKRGRCANDCTCQQVPGPKPVCGNKVLEMSEQCDPPGAACRSGVGQVGVCLADCSCKLQAVCGNKILEVPEECESPGSACATASGKGVCTSSCRCKLSERPYTPGCGNKRLDLGEQCDPPNAPAPGCPPLALPDGSGCAFPICLEGCRCPQGPSCPRGAPIHQLPARSFFDVFFDIDMRSRTTPTPQPPVQPIPTELIPLQLTSQQQLPTTQPPTFIPQRSCEELCAERGHSTQPVDHSQYILAYANKYQCVSGARITQKGVVTLTGPGYDCKCYSKAQPQIFIEEARPQCQTPCGPVSCGSSVQCPCPDSQNCVLTASCEWSGWTWQNGRLSPKIGSQSSAQEQHATDVRQQQQSGQYTAGQESMGVYSK